MVKDFSSAAPIRRRFAVGNLAISSKSAIFGWRKTRLSERPVMRLS